MRIDNSLAFLLSTLCINHTLTLTIPDATFIGLTPLNTTLGSECECIQLSRQAWLSRKFPRGRDCAGAIRQLNDNHRPGIFHSKGVLNDFRLPVAKHYKSCAIKVSMKEGIKEVEGTWNVIGSAAGQLNQVCVGDRYFPQYKGGTTYAGLYDAVRIQLMYFEDGKGRLGIGENGTGVEVGGVSVH